MTNQPRVWDEDAQNLAVDRLWSSPASVTLRQGESISLATGQVFAPANDGFPLERNDLRGLAVAFKIAATPVETAPLSTFMIGDTVTHSHYGRGTVIAFRGATRAVVQFADHDGFHGRLPLIIEEYSLRLG